MKETKKTKILSIDCEDGRVFVHIAFQQPCGDYKYCEDCKNTIQFPGENRVYCWKTKRWIDI